MRFWTRLKTTAKKTITKRPSKTYRLLQSPSQHNLFYKAYNFRKAQKNEGKSLDSFHTRLRTLAKTCKFGDADKEIKEQIILSCNSNAVRRKALREDDDLTALLESGRALEQSETQAKEVESNKTSVNTIQHKNKNETCSKKGKGRRSLRTQTYFRLSLLSTEFKITSAYLSGKTISVT